MKTAAPVLIATTRPSPAVGAIEKAMTWLPV
jgi:hypothetical protein